MPFKANDARCRRSPWSDRARAAARLQGQAG